MFTVAEFFSAVSGFVLEMYIVISAQFYQSPNLPQYNTLKNSLIIHEENTKKNHKRVVSLHVI